MSPQEAEHITDQVLALLEDAGVVEYFGEAVTQLEHALQAADLARAFTTDEEVVLAALLHDVGHLLPEGKRQPGLGVIDHDETGAEYLRGLGFSARVVALVGGHVAAKRFLVATRPEYRSRLSPSSTATLQLQGGPLAEEQVAVFGADPQLDDLLRLRSWDEQAKEPGRPAASLGSYRALLVRHLRRPA